MTSKRVQWGILLSFLLSSATLARAQQASQFHDRIAAIVAGSDTAARRQAITENLKSLGIDYRLDEFTVTQFSGSNIIAEIGT